jgi:hypothetical protein
METNGDDEGWQMGLAKRHRMECEKGASAARLSEPADVGLDQTRKRPSKP